MVKYQLPPKDATPNERSTPPARGHSLRGLGVIGLLLALAGLACAMGFRTWTTAERKESATKMIMLLQDLANYSDLYKTLPAPDKKEESGRALHNWRALLMQFVDDDYFSQIDFNVPWDSPKNREIAGRTNAAYCLHPRANGGPEPHTDVLAIVGPGTAFDEDKPRRYPELPDDLIVLASVRNSRLHWMKPGDFDVRDMPKTVNAADGDGIASPFEAGIFVGFADFQVWFLAKEIPFETLQQFFTVDSARKNDRETLLGPYVLNRFTE